MALPSAFFVVTCGWVFSNHLRKPIDVFGRQQHRQHARAGHALFNQLRWLVGSDWGGFAVTTGVDLAHMLGHADLHGHDFQLLAGFFADGVLVAAASNG